MAENGTIVPTEKLADGSASVELSRELCSINKTASVEHTREYIPSIIESAFGFSRILYAVLEHLYCYRHQDPARRVSSPTPPNM